MTGSCRGRLVCAFCAVWASEVLAAILYLACGGAG